MCCKLVAVVLIAKRGPIARSSTRSSFPLPSTSAHGTALYTMSVMAVTLWQLFLLRTVMKSLWKKTVEPLTQTSRYIRLLLRRAFL